MDSEIFSCSKFQTHVYSCTPYSIWTEQLITKMQYKSCFQRKAREKKSNFCYLPASDQLVPVNYLEKIVALALSNGLAGITTEVK